MIAAIVFSAIVLSTVTCEQITYKDCRRDHGHAHAMDVQMSPCPSMPCVFEKGMNVNVTISFTAQHDSPTLAAKVYGIILGLDIPYPLPQGDACQNSNIQCPIVKGQRYTYHGTFPVLEAYPKIDVLVRWKLIVAHHVDETCFTFPMSIVDKHSDPIVG